jgi:hypothetical protein
MRVNVALYTEIFTIVKSMGQECTTQMRGKFTGRARSDLCTRLQRRGARDREVRERRGDCITVLSDSVYPQARKYAENRPHEEAGFLLYCLIWMCLALSGGKSRKAGFRFRVRGRSTHTCLF